MRRGGSEGEGVVAVGEGRIQWRAKEESSGCALVTSCRTMKFDSKLFSCEYA
jgi:hypothetical protein